jgi:hypothetical protein
LLQRWVTADPLAIHVPGDADLNLYAYVRGMALKAVDPFGLQDSGGAPGWDPDDVAKGGSAGGPGVDIAAPDIRGSEAATEAVKLVGVLTSGPAAGLGTSCDSSSCVGENSDPLTAPGFALGVTAVRAAVAAPRVAVRVAESLEVQLTKLQAYVDDFFGAGDDLANAAVRSAQQGAAEALPTMVPRLELTMPKVGDAARGAAAETVSVLPSSGRVLVGTPGGQTVTIPEGWAGRAADSGKGLVYQRPGATGNADMIRIMDPTSQYPSGYVRYSNQYGQPLDAFGKPGSQATTHIPLDYQGPIPGWPQ